MSAPGMGNFSMRDIANFNLVLHDFPSRKYFIDGFEEFLKEVVEFSHNYLELRSQSYLDNGQGAANTIWNDLFLLYSVSLVANERNHLGWIELNERLYIDLIGVARKTNFISYSLDQLFSSLTVLRLFSLTAQSVDLKYLESELFDLLENKPTNCAFYRGRGHLALVELSVKCPGLVPHWHDVLYI